MYKFSFPLNIFCAKEKKSLILDSSQIKFGRFFFTGVEKTELQCRNTLL